ncbi:uncharacterized protein B0H64DRAFT_391840 [Chaetomium fimeti]|uniref:Secreted protein n=1 Tax=Chaetomium fimeti TaxID=1854472 RepID=A0AAE0LUG9_9PEZI|nr:hypothetical protein B0H64DRAFT_391840 [Chaetomium fimeti]
MGFRSLRIAICFLCTTSSNKFCPVSISILWILGVRPSGTGLEVIRGKEGKRTPPLTCRRPQSPQLQQHPVRTGPGKPDAT